MSVRGARGRKLYATLRKSKQNHLSAQYNGKKSNLLHERL